MPSRTLTRREILKAAAAAGLASACAPDAISRVLSASRVPPPDGPSIALVTGQKVVATGSSAAPTCTLPGATTTGNLVLVTLVWYSTSVTVTGATDPNGTPLIARAAKQGLNSSSAWSIQNFWLPNVVGSANPFNATLSGSAGWTMWASEWSGAQVSEVADSGNTATDAYASGTSTAPASVSVTPSVANCLLYGVILDAGGTAVTPGSGYTILSRDTSETGASTLYTVQGAAAQITVNGTFGSQAWDALALIIQPASGGGGSLYPNQPAGYTVLAETNDNLLPSSSANLLKGSIWGFGSTPSTLLQVVNTGTVPEAGYGTIPAFPNQSKVLQFNFETGTPPGYQESGSHGAGFYLWQNGVNSPNGGPAADEFSAVYYSVYFCVFGNGTNIEVPTAELIKIHYWGGSFNNLNSSGAFVQYFWLLKCIPANTNTGVSPFTCTEFSLSFCNQGGVGATTDYDQNLNLSKHVVVGQVHHMESVLTIGTDGNADATADVWLDGTHVLTYNDLKVLDHTVTYAGAPGTAGWDTLNFEPWWGGSGGANKSRNDYLYFGHMYCSGIFLRAHT